MKINMLYCTLFLCVPVTIQIDPPAWMPVPATRQPKFDPTKAHDFRLPEPTRDDRRRNNDYNFLKSFYSEEYLHLFIAGKAEFPWVVHITTNQSKNVVHSVGSLISTQHVLTTCRAMTRLNCTPIYDHDCQPDEIQCPCSDATRYDRLEFSHGLSMVHYYSTLPDDQDMIRIGNQYRLTGDDSISGTRPIYTSVINQNCQWDEYLHDDQVVLFLARPVAADSPWLHIVPINVDEIIKNIDKLAFTGKSRILCYVATIGRYYHYHFEGAQPDLPDGFKAKFRAYRMEWSLCQKYARYICRGEVCKNHTEYFDYGTEHQHYKIECWDTRNIIGAICDRDTGASLVCDGKSEGMVIRGAFGIYCNFGLPMPFIVQRWSFGIALFLSKLIDVQNKYPLKESPIHFPENYRG